MAGFTDTSTLRGARSPMKNSTVYNRGGYRAAPPIYETGEDGNLRETSGGPKAAGADQPAAPAFTRVFADTPRPQGSNLAGSLAQTALAKVGGKALDKGFDAVRSSFNDAAMADAPVSVNPGGYGPASSTARLSESTFGPARDSSSFADSVRNTGADLSPDAGSLGSASDMADGVSGGVDLATGLDVGAGSLGDASDLADVGGAVGDAAGGIPFLGAAVKAAQGDVGGAAGSVVGGLIAGPIGAVIGGLVGGGRVICTELSRQGLLDADLYRLDVQFTPRLPAAVVRGYHWWAIPYVSLMRRSAWATRIARPLATWRARAIAHTLGQGPRCWRGSAVRAVGEPLCHLIGLFVGPQDFTCLQKGAQA